MDVNNFLQFAFIQNSINFPRRFSSDIIQYDMMTKCILLLILFIVHYKHINKKNKLTGQLLIIINLDQYDEK